jgi:hypothetical protein
MKSLPPHGSHVSKMSLLMQIALCGQTNVTWNFPVNVTWYIHSHMVMDLHLLVAHYYSKYIEYHTLIVLLRNINGTFIIIIMNTS